MINFEISNKQVSFIQEWQTKHLREKHWDNEKDKPYTLGIMGGTWEYTFIPLVFGSQGYCKCAICGEKYNFDDLL